MEKQNLCIQAFSFAPFFFYLIIFSFEKKKVSIYYCIIWYTFLYFLTIRKQKQRINKTINAKKKKKHNITCSCCHSLKRLFNFWTILATAIATVGATINTNTNNKNNSRRKRITISEKYKQILWKQKIGLKSFSN